MDRFELICQHKDSESSNLNQVFDSYGCNTLEAKVPIINEVTVERLNEITPEQKMYATLALKSKSASEALDGRVPRTRNRTLKMVEIDNEIVLAVGQVREESPVDPEALDDELEQYMRERARLKAQNKVATDTEDEQISIERNKPKLEETTVEAMDLDLDSYMKEAARKRSQKKKFVEQLERSDAMNKLEEDFDRDFDDQGGDRIQF